MFPIHMSRGKCQSMYESVSDCFSPILAFLQWTARMWSRRGCTLWTPPCREWPSPAQWGCPCPAPRVAPPMQSSVGTWPPATTSTTCPTSATCTPMAHCSSTPSPPLPSTASSMTTTTSALQRTRPARSAAQASASKQVRIRSFIHIHQTVNLSCPSSYS